jgi:hypothetical protein
MKLIEGALDIGDADEVRVTRLRRLPAHEHPNVRREGPEGGGDAQTRGTDRLGLRRRP